MRSVIVGVIAVALLAGAASSGGGMPGFLIGSLTGNLSGGPREGDIKFKDGSGHWYIVQGVPINPAPPDENAVTVGIIDSGVLPDHPQLKGLIAEQRDFTGEGNLDLIGHGTLITILVRKPAADLRMTNSPFRFVVAKVANVDGSINKDAVVTAIQWVVQRGAKVVNLSLGFREGSGDYSEICEIIRRSSETFFSAAAGNFGPTVRVFPAACRSQNLLSVAATDESGQIAKYSGRGDIAASGIAILVPATDDRH
jgi:subtilisin family serine protease